MKSVFNHEDNGFVLVKDYKPKYKTIELILYGNKPKFLLQRLPFELVVKRYGEQQVLSVRDYDDTKTTSMIIGV